MVVTELELGAGLAWADGKAPTPARDGAASRLVRSCAISVRTRLEITKLKLVRSQKNPWPSMNRPLAVRIELRTASGLFIEGQGFFCDLTNFKFVISNRVRTLFQHDLTNLLGWAANPFV